MQCIFRTNRDELTDVSAFWYWAVRVGGFWGVLTAMLISLSRCGVSFVSFMLLPFKLGDTAHMEVRVMFMVMVVRPVLLAVAVAMMRGFMSRPIIPAMMICVLVVWVVVTDLVLVAVRIVLVVVRIVLVPVCIVLVAVRIVLMPVTMHMVIIVMKAMMAIIVVMPVMI